MKENIAKLINKLKGIMALLLVLAMPLLAINSCSTGIEPELPVSLEGTFWKLTSIEAINDSTWWFENGIWTPPEDETYSIAFKDSFLIIQAYCEHCSGFYSNINNDSIEIDLHCSSDVSCGLNLDFKYRLDEVKTYTYSLDNLHLQYDANWMEMEGILHFEEMETED